MKMKNVRFWVYLNGGPVKVTIETGQTLRHSKWARTDEGWSSEANSWSWDGSNLTREWCFDGRDCDGRLTQCGSDKCVDVAGIEDSEGLQLDGSVICYPKWEEIEPCNIRDEYAQAMNY